MEDDEPHGTAKDFIDGCWLMIDYWQNQNTDERGKMTGLVHSILGMLEGNAGCFDGNIETLAKEEGVCLNEMLYHQGDRKSVLAETEMAKSMRANMENQLRMMDKMKWAPVIYEDEE